MAYWLEHWCLWVKLAISGLLQIRIKVRQSRTIEQFVDRFFG